MKIRSEIGLYIGYSLGKFRPADLRSKDARRRANELVEGPSVIPLDTSSFDAYWPDYPDNYEKILEGEEEFEALAEYRKNRQNWLDKFLNLC